MTFRQRLARALVCLYPAAWRREYGEELLDLLVARPLTTPVVVDVLWNSARMRVRFAEPSTVLGLGSMLVVLAGFVVPPFRYSSSVTDVLRPSHMTFPTVVVTFMVSQVYIALLMVCGWWTGRRHHCQSKRCGLAAMRMSLIAGAPVLIAGVLVAMHAISVTFAGMEGTHPLPIEVIAAPLARLPEAFLYGSMGAWVQRHSVRTRKPA
jgi:hypothetical protein